MKIEQFLPAFLYGDAISNSALCFHHFLLKCGIESQLISLTCDSIFQEKVTLFHDYPEDSEAIKILHFAVPSLLTDYFLQAKGKKAMIYHNVTPGHFFEGFSDFLKEFTQKGRQHLSKLVNSFDLAIGVSRYNAQELKNLGYPVVKVFPLLIDMNSYNGSHQEEVYNRLKDDRKNILFVGRVIPNKKIEDLIKLVIFYKKCISPEVRLIVMGNTQSLPEYFFKLKYLAYRFLTFEDVIFTGHLPFAEFLSVYRAADLFVSMSEHEGFCLPLIESCFFGLPILAYDAGAVGEILSGAGILFKKKKFDYLAVLTDYALKDQEMRKLLRSKALQHFEKYKMEADPGRLLNLLKEL